MIDKYSGVEEKLEEIKGRNDFLKEIFSLYFGDFLEYVDWELAQEKKTGKGGRINIVNIVSKKSSVRFFVEKEKDKIEKYFFENSLKGIGVQERLILRIK